jgi:hypothetical protein
MNKFILRGGSMFLAFTIGLGGTFLINAVVERWIATPEPVLEEPCALVLAQQQRLMPSMGNCGLLMVEVGNDRSLWLRGERQGNLDDPSSLLAKLSLVFKWRSEAHAYRPGFELNSDVPEEDRIEKTVLVKAPRSISYGEVSDLIDVIRTTGAEPIGLVTDGVFTSEQRRTLPVGATWLNR